MVQGLYNTMLNERRAIAYCHKHHCCVSSTQLKQKECLRKQCTYLQKYEHEFWRQRELTKVRKKNKGGV